MIWLSIPRRSCWALFYYFFSSRRLTKFEIIPTWLLTTMIAISTPLEELRNLCIYQMTKMYCDLEWRRPASPRRLSSSANSPIECLMSVVSVRRERSGSTALRMSQQSYFLLPSPSTINFFSRMRRWTVCKRPLRCLTRSATPDGSLKHQLSYS